MDKHIDGLAQDLIGSVVFYIWDANILFEEFHHSEWHIRAARVQSVMFNGSGFFVIITEGGDIVRDWHGTEESALEELKRMIKND